MIILKGITTNISNAPIMFPTKLDSYEIKGQIVHNSETTILLASIIKEKFGAAEAESLVKLTAGSMKKLEALVAIKKINIADSNLELADITKETAMMMDLKHPNIVQYYTAFYEEECINIIMELCAASLRDILEWRVTSIARLKPVPVMKAKEVASVLKQLLSGLGFMAEKGYIHRDIKAANILINKDGMVKISDFGVSAKISVLSRTRDTRSTFVGTFAHMAPEVISGDNYSVEADVWSLGITCLEMASGTAPYYECPPCKIITEILNKPPPTLQTCALTQDQFKSYPKSFNKFLERCLVREFEKRGKLKDLLTHEFVTSNAKVLYFNFLGRWRVPTFKNFLYAY